MGQSRCSRSKRTGGHRNRFQRRNRIRDGPSACGQKALGSVRRDDESKIFFLGANRSKRAEYTGERIKIKTVVIGGRQKSGQITQYDPGSAWHEVC